MYLCPPPSGKFFTSRGGCYCCFCFGLIINVFSLYKMYDSEGSRELSRNIKSLRIFFYFFICSRMFYPPLYFFGTHAVLPQNLLCLCTCNLLSYLSNKFPFYGVRKSTKMCKRDVTATEDIHIRQWIFNKVKPNCRFHNYCTRMVTICWFFIVFFQKEQFWADILLIRLFRAELWRKIIRTTRINIIGKL